MEQKHILLSTLSVGVGVGSGLGLAFGGQSVGLAKEDQKKFFRKAFHTYYDAAVELLQSEHSALCQMEAKNAKTLNDKGELSEKSALSYERLRKSYDHLYRGILACYALSDASSY